MANSTTARALSGLINDLDDDELRTLTASENRPGLKEFLAARLPKREYETWKQIKLGTHKDAAALIESLEKGDFRIYDWARDIMSKPAFTVASEEIAVDLVVVSARELGFKRGATYAKIIERAQERGLKLCEAEVGPQLRLQYPDQEVGEWLGIGMECIAGSGGGPSFFAVGRNGGARWLDTDYGNDGTWRADRRFVFRK